MLSLAYPFFLFGFFVPFTSLLANAFPGLPPPPSSVSITLTRPAYQHASGSGAYTHGSIVQQQYTNRGLRRLALMTGNRGPSDHELLWLLYRRIAALPDPQRQEYSFDQVTAILSEHNLSTSSEDYSKGLDAVLCFNQSRIPPRKEVRALTTPASALHTTGLKIESNDIGYIAKMNIGTPHKPFRLLVDSGSADLWVGSTNCRSDDGGGCGNHNFLGPNSSSSYVQSTNDWAIGYVSGSVWGLLVNDVVSVAGLTLKNHTFGVAFNESADFTGKNILFDGLLGLAKSVVSQQHVPTFLQSLVQSQLICSSIVSYKIPRLADGKNDTGELTLGAMDPNHYDPTSVVTVKNVNKFGFWGAAVDAVKVGGRDMHWRNRTILMDTGTTMIIAPKGDVQAIHDAIPGSQYDGSGYTVPCNMTTVLSLTVGDRAFTVDPRDIAFYPIDQGSTTCMSGIGVGGVGPFYLDTDWLVGDVFLKNVYFSTDEDNDEISIARPLY